jgi:hypothetical protein
MEKDTRYHDILYNEDNDGLPLFPTSSNLLNKRLANVCYVFHTPLLEFDLSDLSEYPNVIHIYPTLSPNAVIFSGIGNISVEICQEYIPEHETDLIQKNDKTTLFINIHDGCLCMLFRNIMSLGTNYEHMMLSYMVLSEFMPRDMVNEVISSYILLGYEF